MRNWLVVALVAGCGSSDEMKPPVDIDAPPIAADAFMADAYLGTLLGYSCPLPPEPALDRCSTGPVDDLAYCVDEAGNGVCRPSCYYKGTMVSRCATLGGNEYTFRGACICAP